MPGTIVRLLTNRLRHRLIHLFQIAPPPAAGLLGIGCSGQSGLVSAVQPTLVTDMGFCRPLQPA